MTWIRTGANTRTDRWTDQDLIDYNHGTSQHIEWYELNTGASYCLVTRTISETIGDFHLLWKSPEATKPTDVTTLLWPLEKTRFTDAPEDRKNVKFAIQDFVDHLLGAEPLFTVYKQIN